MATAIPGSTPANTNNIVKMRQILAGLGLMSSNGRKYASRLALGPRFKELIPEAIRFAMATGVAEQTRSKSGATIQAEIEALLKVATNPDSELFLKDYRCIEIADSRGISFAWPVLILGEALSGTEGMLPLHPFVPLDEMLRFVFLQGEKKEVYESIITTARHYLENRFGLLECAITAIEWENRVHTRTALPISAAIGFSGTGRLGSFIGYDTEGCRERINTRVPGSGVAKEALRKAAEELELRELSTMIKEEEYAKMHFGTFG